MDTKMLSFVAQLSNDELLARVKHLAEREREATASLIAYLAELDQRRLYLAEGYSSLFAYCTQVLYLSGSAAYRRIEAARMVRRFPFILELLEQGSVNLTTVDLISAHLTQENHREVLDAVRHKSKQQVEELLARLRPQPLVTSTVRRLPTTSRTFASSPATHIPITPQPTGNGQGVAAPDVQPPAFEPSQRRPAVVIPLTPERYKVQFTVSGETREKLRLAQNLLRHQIPDGDLTAIFDRALTALLQDLAKKKFAATDHPRGSCSSAPARDTFRPRSNARSGSATAGVARSWAATAAAVASRGSLSSTMSLPMPWVARPRSTTSSSGAARTTGTRASSISALGIHRS